ncbi:hypothetical protein LCGC14_2508010, partial [marine sediment metagenome]
SSAVYIGRPSKWGNPFQIGRRHEPAQGQPDIIIDREWAVYLYREMVEDWKWRNTEAYQTIREELKGKNLVCWCAPLPCHGDVLLELANEEGG